MAKKLPEKKQLTLAAFVDEMKVFVDPKFLPEITADMGDKYLLQAVEELRSVRELHGNLRVRESSIDDVVRWCGKLAATLFHVAVAAEREARSEYDPTALINTEDVRQLFGGMTRQAVSLFVAKGMLRVAFKKTVGKTGRPTNYFVRSEVLAAKQQYDKANARTATKEEE